MFPCGNNNVQASGYHTESDKLIRYDKLGKRKPFWSFAQHDDCLIHVVQLNLLCDLDLHRPVGPSHIQLSTVLEWHNQTTHLGPIHSR